MTVYLIRHGKTIANEQHLYCGKTDLSLSEEGRNSLSQLHYPIPKSFRYISSGMRRANETLEILFPDTPFEILSDLREVDFGQFEIRSYEELKDDPAYLEWITGDNEANIPPEGESGEQMTLRTLAAFQHILDDSRDAVIVTHGGVIAALMAHLFPEEQKNRYQWQSPNGGGYCLTFHNGTNHYSPIDFGARPCIK